MRRRRFASRLGIEQRTQLFQVAQGGIEQTAAALKLGAQLRQRVAEFHHSLLLESQSGLDLDHTLPQVLLAHFRYPLCRERPRPMP